MNYKHGDSSTRFYEIWSGIKNRCINTKSKYFQKGITYCSQWEDYLIFRNDMYESYLIHARNYGEENTTIDRIDVNGNYEPTNCRWATYEDQAKNRNSNIFIEYNNKVQCLNDWANELNINRITLIKRLEQGWSVEKAFEIPVKRGQRTNQETITYKNITKTINEWAIVIGIKPCTLRIRIRRGWDIDKALNFIKID